MTSVARLTVLVGFPLQALTLEKLEQPQNQPFREKWQHLFLFSLKLNSRNTGFRRDWSILQLLCV